ncbi:NlpC/P60 family protein [Limosilactobacillus secaliphilus]|uniref:Peptidase M23 n=1 Tax=Limosilactobacillus secaliphilus TaxID=396268 RepID=A0A0R2HZ79_9LACO|nr:NlpC/P60 family protein [Limosilactobacillus secaliphilus]KRN58137.1 Peptidase M23 [Limosilactobacillus secaliphilus]
MDTKKHYKMYKNGKQWCYAAIATVSVAVGIFTGSTAAQADTTPAQPAVATQQTNNASSSAMSSSVASTSAQLSSVKTWQPADAQMQKATANADNGNHAYLDNVDVSNGSLHLSGWNASNQDQGKNYHYVIVYDQTQHRELARQAVQNTERDDVQNAYQGVYNAKYSGFSADFNIDSSAYLNDTLQIVSRYSASESGNSNYVDYWFNPINLNKRGYYIDSLKQTEAGLKVSGWMIDSQSYSKHNAYVFLMRDGKEVARQHVILMPRHDVARAYKDVYNSANSGFNVTFNVDPYQLTGNLQIMMRFTDDVNGNGNFSDQYSKVYTTNAGYTDNFTVQGNHIHLSGWHAATNAQGMDHQFIIVLDMNNHELYRTELTAGQKNLSRNDVAKAYPWMSNANVSGYSVDIPLLDSMQHKGLKIVHRYSTSADGNSNYVDFWDNSHSVNSGWQGDHYYDPTTGRMATGQTNINGQTYYFDNNGKLMSRQQEAVNRALSVRGTRYVWGGNTPAGFDCSGLVQWAYGLDGGHRTTYTQETLGAHHYDVYNAPVGALVFFGSGTAPYHVGISLGNGTYVHAPEPGDVVKVTEMRYYQPTFYVVM